MGSVNTADLKEQCRVAEDHRQNTACNARSLARDLRQAADRLESHPEELLEILGMIDLLKHRELNRAYFPDWLTMSW